LASGCCYFAVEFWRGKSESDDLFFKIIFKTNILPISLCWKMYWRRSNRIYSRINQTIIGFFEIGFKLTVNSVDASIRYKETSLWESGPLPILALLLSRFIVVVLFIDSMLFADTITSGDFLLPVTTVINSFSFAVVCVDREMHVVSDSPFFRSFNSIS